MQALEVPQPGSALSPSLFDTENSSLCTDTVQVRKTELNYFQKQELCKGAVVEWLENNGYRNEAYRIQECGTSYVHLRDQNGHEKYSKLHCNQEYCPECGLLGSQLHKKRFARAMDRLIWADVLGYVVFTLPKEISLDMPAPEDLSKLAKKAWQIVKKNFKTCGGVARYHLLGNEPENLHIHINVLFPIMNEDGKGRVDQEVLDRVRTQWTSEINRFFNLSYDAMNVYYKFAPKLWNKIHKIKYVFRPIVTARKFLTLSDENRHKIVNLKGWHNTRWYGNLANSKYRKFLAGIGVDPQAEQKKDVDLTNVCPVCGEKYKYIDIIHKNAVPHTQLRFINANTLVDRETFSVLRKGGPG